MLSWRRQLALVGGITVAAVALVFGGNGLLAAAAGALLGDRPLVHLVAGALWTTVAVGLLVDPERLRGARRRWSSRVGWRAVHAPSRRRREAARAEADRAGRAASDHRSYRALLRAAAGCRAPRQPAATAEGAAPAALTVTAARGSAPRRRPAAGC